MKTDHIVSFSGGACSFWAASRVVPSGDPSAQEAQATAEARVARLKGYGNAIVPPLAAEFILAFLESL